MSSCTMTSALEYRQQSPIDVKHKVWYDIGQTLNMAQGRMSFSKIRVTLEEQVLQLMLNPA